MRVQLDFQGNLKVTDGTSATSDFRILMIIPIEHIGLQKMVLSYLAANVDDKDKAIIMGIFEKVLGNETHTLN